MLITILGSTATGKTTLATHLAATINGEIISADSRQVYRGMDIGTGKDLIDYTINGIIIPYHLIDIIDAGEEYNLFEFLCDFHNAHEDIIKRNRQPILCGGTGLYIHGVINGYNMTRVDKNKELRAKLATMSVEELQTLLKSKVEPCNMTDTSSRPRLVRAIEIANAEENPDKKPFEPIKSIIFGINLEREIVRNKITQRLKDRLNEGMIDEVKGLLDKGVSTEMLMRYGLEYKFVTQYLNNTISRDEMFQLLNIAIHQFSRRQMTWFRKMEREGVDINWIDGMLPLNEKIDFIINKLAKQPI